MQAFFSRASGSVPYYHDMQTFATILSRHVRHSYYDPYFPFLHCTHFYSDTSIRQQISPI
ncbi:hypothetical protein P389DRAFT_172004 [Cystobasidium minutum MCA 4210]|uniref:uncharacterized protein n=1 Tax=Cystobasidium minutum MCA 4210 TaxID=1397322 RepID=UPI0034CEAB1D|eukprot:jgi/Rhomi1/172004/fgenesh1_kg.4_\